MKCGYFKYEERTNPFRTVYSCNYFGTLSNTEKCLCAGCHIDHTGTPHLESLKSWNCPQDTTKCYWHKKGKPCKECKYKEEDDNE